MFSVNILKILYKSGKMWYQSADVFGHILQKKEMTVDVS